MSAHDDILTTEEAEAEFTEVELEEYLLDAFAEIAEFESERRAFHDRDGYLAELAGSVACAALGHAAHVDEDSPLYDEWIEAHPVGWSGEHLCEATRFGSACTACESESCDFRPAPSLWDLPGVTGRAR